MTKTAKYLSLTACALATSLLLSGCGGGADTESGAPTVTISAAESGSKVLFTFVFSDDVGTTFTADDVAVVGGAKASSVTKIDATHYTLEVTPDGSNSNVTASVASGKFSAVARNTNTSSSTAALPGAAPLSPTLAAADVIAIYSDAYTQVASLNLFPDWGQPTAATEISFSGNKVEKYSGLTYEGIEFSSVNVSGMSKLHIDVWTPDLTALKVSIISPGKENAVTVNPTQNGWNSFDIDLAQYTVPDKANISQIKLEAGAPSSGTVYVDNIYFSKASSGGAAAPTTAPTVPTALAANVKSLYSESYTTTGGFDLPSWGQGQMLSDATIAGNKVLKGDAFTYQGFQFDPIDATTLGLTSLHIDVWSADATPVKAYVISNGQDTEYVDIVPTAGAWKAVDIPLSSFSKINKGAIFQLKLDTAIQPTTKVMYFDNIYFVKVNSGTGTAPTTAPTAPTALAANVKSLYSETYTTTGGFDLPSWGQGQMLSDATIAGNKVLKGDAFTYQGFQFDPIDATTLGLTSLHIDVWSADATPVKAYVISNGQDTEYVDIVPTAGAWKAVDIPLSSFSKINKGAIFQLKLDTAIQPTTKVMYFDNIYFTK